MLLFSVHRAVFQPRHTVGVFLLCAGRGELSARPCAADKEAGPQARGAQDDKAVLVSCFPTLGSAKDGAPKFVQRLSSISQALRPGSLSVALAELRMTPLEEGMSAARPFLGTVRRSGGSS